MSKSIILQMKKTEWFERNFNFSAPPGMLPFFLERLEGTIVRLEKKVSGVADPVLSEKLDGKWSVKQNIGHLVDVDEISWKRLDEIRQGVSPMSPAVFEPRQDYNSQNIHDILKYFRANREQNIKKYRSISDADLEKSSLHPRLKVMMSPVDLALFEAEHDDHHIVRISEILATLHK
jgi:hypothetical protein